MLISIVQIKIHSIILSIYDFSLQKFKTHQKRSPRNPKREQ